MNMKETDAILRNSVLDAVMKAFEKDAPVKIDEGAIVIPTIDANGAERFVEVKVIAKAPKFNLDEAVAEFADTLAERAHRAAVLAQKKADKEKAKKAKG
jgi:hypothetical protein